MLHKPFVRNMLAAAAIFMVVVTCVTVLVLAATGDPEPTYDSPTLPEAPISAEKQDDTPPSPGSALHLTAPVEAPVQVQFQHTDEILPYETIYVDDPTMQKGKQVIQTEGKTGLLRHTEEILLHDGEEVSRQSAGSRVLREPVDEVILVGTYVAPPATVVSTHNNSSGTVTSYDYTRNFLDSVSIDEVNKTITTPYGEVFTYTDCFIGEATAYSCEGNPNAITATGTKARVGEVAVDPKFIPLGTRMFIMLSDGSLIYGYCVAEDTGGAVKGNIIDLYMNTIADCSLVGRSDCTVYILK